MSKQILERNLTTHGHTLLDFLKRGGSRRGSGSSLVHAVLTGRFETLAGDFETVPRVDGTFADHLRVDGARLGGGVRRGLRVDPEAVDADAVGFGVSGVGGDGAVVVVAVTVAVGIGVEIVGDIGFEDDVFFGQFDVLAVCEGYVEVGETAAVEHEDGVALFAEGALRQLADEECAFNATLFPLARGRAEDVDDGIGGEREDVLDGGVVTAEDG